MELNRTANFDPDATSRRPAPASSGVRWWVLGFLFVIYTLASADRANIGIVLPHLVKQFNFNNTEAGEIASLFFLAYAAGQIPSAFIVKRFGVRHTLTLSLLLTSIFTGLHGLVESASMLRICRVGLGLAEAPIAVACITAINNWFPKREKGTAAGIFLSSAKFGPVIVPPLGAVIILSLGWHYIFLLFALPGLILPFLWLAFVPDRPADSRWVSRSEAALIDDKSVADGGKAIHALRPVPTWLDTVIRTRPVAECKTTGQILSSWTVWGVSLGYFVLTGTINVILAWLPTYLQEVKQFSIMNTGFVASAPFIGAVLGAFGGGLISDRLLGGRRKPMMLVACAATIVMMFALRSSPNDPFALGALLLLTGFALSLGYSCFPIYFGSFTSRATFPIAVAILNTSGQLGGAAMPFVTGIILDRYSWDMVFVALSIASLVSFLLLMTVVEPLQSEAANS